MAATARRPLDAAALAAWVAGPGSASGWREVRVVATTGSTNSDLADLARAGEPAGLVLAAEAQTAGRGRLDRSWTAPPGSGLAVSALVRLGRSPAAYGWLPLLAGLAAAEALTGATGVDVRLKWPNDLLVGEAKLGGLLCERVGSAVVVGLGVNVSLARAELPVPHATSLALEGAAGDGLDRTALLVSVLERLGRRLASWEAGADDELRASYRDRCATLGRVVRAELPGGSSVTGTADDVDRDGHLLVREPAGGSVALAAADVVHVRATG